MFQGKKEKKKHLNSYQSSKKQKYVFINYVFLVFKTWFGF